MTSNPSKHNESKTPQPEQAISAGKNTSTKQQKYRGGSFFSGLISIAALASSLYVAAQQYTLTDTFKNITSNLKKEVVHQATNQARQHDQLNDSVGRLNQTIHQHEQEISSLSRSLATQINHKASGQQQWRLAKAAYLIEMAQLTLEWEKTPQAAATLLQTADKIIYSLNNPRYFALRQTLSNEISALNALPQPDITGLITQLSALDVSIHAMPLKYRAPSSQPGKLQPTVKAEETIPTWRKALNTSIDTLTKIVVIRRNNENYQPLLSQQEKHIILQQIMLDIEMAQWALLKRDQRLFQQCLAKALRYTEQYFDPSDRHTKHALTILQTIKGTTISAPLPNIKKSYQQLTALMEETTATDQGDIK